MVAKKVTEIDFGKRKPVEGIPQEQKENGQVGEKNTWTSVNIDADLYRQIRVHLVQKGVNINDFFVYWIENAVNNNLKDIPEAPKLKDTMNQSLYMAESKKKSFKAWLTLNNVKMRDVIEYSIRQELKLNP